MILSSFLPSLGKFMFKIKKHINDIRNLGVKEFLRKTNILIKKILNTFLILIALPTLFFLILIKPFINIRFGIIRSSRVGHFLANTTLYLCEKKIENSKIKNIDFVSFDGSKIINTFLKKKFLEKIKIYPYTLINPFCDVINFFEKKNLNFFKNNKISRLYAHGDRDIDGILYQSDNLIKFNQNECQILDKEIQKFGINNKSKFICLDVRDSAYLKETFPKGDWSYHNYRDWDIENFYLACENLTQRGYYIFRMGKLVKNKLPTKNPMIIDYANSEIKSDILDVYLHSKCSFCITTGTGIDLASYIFKRPIIMMTASPMSLYTFNNFYHVIKNFHDKDMNKISLSEIFDKCFQSKPEIFNPVSKNFKLSDLDKFEINEILLEYANIIEGKFEWTDEDKVLQERFWQNYKRLVEKHNVEYLHKNYQAKISPTFLKKNLELLK